MKADVQSGVGVDAFGGQVVDPTLNVTRLVEANKLSADALREMHDRCIQAEIQGVRETVKWLEKLSDVHQKHDREIHKMEQEKLAAFRASDDAARLTEANRGLAAIEVLARTTQSTADNLRSALEATTATRDQRIAALEKSSYEGAGKGTGTKNLWAYIFAGCGLAIAAAGFALTFLVVLAGIVVYAVRVGG